MGRGGGGIPKWTGRGRTLRDKSVRPRLLGSAPTFELSEGAITLRSTDSGASFSFKAGVEALARVLQDGDSLYVARSGTCDLAFSALRNNDFILAMGALAGARLVTEIRVGDVGGDLVNHVLVLIRNQAYELLEGEELHLEP